MEIFSRFWTTNFGSFYNTNVTTFINTFYDLEKSVYEYTDKNKWEVFGTFLSKNGIIDYDLLSVYIRYFRIYYTYDIIKAKNIIYEILSYPGFVKIYKDIRLKDNQYIIRPDNKFFTLYYNYKNYNINWSNNNFYLPEEYQSDTFYGLMKNFMKVNGPLEPYFLNFNVNRNLNIDFKFEMKFTDLKINLKGGSIDVHKIILYSISEYFKAMFDSSFIESRSNEIKIDEDIKNFLPLIQYIYNPPIFLTFDTATAYKVIILLIKYSFYNDYLNLILLLDFSNVENFGDIADDLLKHNVPIDIIAAKIDENSNLNGLSNYDITKLIQSRYLGIKDFTVDTDTVKLALQILTSQHK